MIYTGLRADAWVPLMMQPQLRPRSNLTTASWLWLFGRLRDGATHRGGAAGAVGAGGGASGGAWARGPAPARHPRASASRR